ncbi:MAG: threonine-phosphate decarboxylase [Betaproteobacteria bacterium]|nr:threonine-phosphate decarboxylase [Betaproteobacteria bacterium]
MLEHGGNLSLASKMYGIPLADWLDLSTGINPDNYPVTVVPDAVWQRLPDNDDDLIKSACSYYGCQSLLPTAGSQAALQVLPRLRPVCKVAMLNPMYREHAHAWQRQGHAVSSFTSLADTSVAQADVVLICNPNNPTARLFTPMELLDLHNHLRRRGGWLIVDEAFMDTTPEYSIAQHAHLEGLFVLRSLGKFFGLAGARVGFLLAEDSQLARVQEELGPWTLTGASRLIAKQALLDKAWQDKTRLALAHKSQRLVALLSEHHLAPQAGTALFQYTPTAKAIQWQHHLATRGIWVRLFTDTPALRFGLPHENGWGRLEEALKTL